MSKERKKKAELAMGDLWVMAAVILAFKKAHKLSDRAYLRQFERNNAKLFAKVNAFRLDPANRDAIIAVHCEAAAGISRGNLLH